MWKILNDFLTGLEGKRLQITHFWAQESPATNSREGTVCGWPLDDRERSMAAETSQDISENCSIGHHWLFATGTLYKPYAS